MLKLSALLSSLKNCTVEPDISAREVSIRSVVTDSRNVESGDMFVALIGEREDGHSYIKAAVKAGASVVLAQRWPQDLGTEAVTRVIVDDTRSALQCLARGWRDRHQVTVAAITGSVGKTSTKDAVAALLATKFKVMKSLGNLNTEIGIPLTLLELDESCEKAVLEMGMYVPGDIALLCKIAKPDVGVVTNVGPTHMGRTGSLEATAMAKRELVEALNSDGIAILNGDDHLVSSMAAFTKASTIIYGTTSGLDLWSENIDSRGLSGISFTMHWRNEKRAVETPLMGRHSVYTALAASAVALSQGISLDEVVLGLQSLSEGNRIKVLRGLMGCTILDDTYNSSPASCVAALDLLSQLDGHRIAVLGDMLELGQEEGEGHRKVGRRAATAVDHLITVGARARTIADEARKSGLDDVEAVYTHAAAEEAIKGVMRPACSILVKGSRSMAMEHIVKSLQ
ncbi:MAG: UDP-N-acetylmuramoyl-tripeptide--D-alanyl-D-alanine ligase [Dehalococcoidia bacterium]|nr:UDP-N-acetylmuramoyl-tripeptide--D-alanyl-D-alanine ligase [Dehalococcoidia bacterium]